MKKINLIQIGIGNVGKALIKQIIGNKERLKRNNGIDIQHCALFNSSGGLVNLDGLSSLELKDRIVKLTRGLSIKKFIENSASSFLRNSIILDLSTADNLFPIFYKALKKGASVVLSNKRPLASKLSEFHKLSSFGPLKIMHETTVGAGLPVIRTLHTLLSTGDEIIEIDGCFSGTLGFLCSRLEEGKLFSETISEAKRLGYTEFDPREDLSGADVARKTLILARMLGQKVEMSYVKVDSLYPSSFDKFSVEEFMEETKKLDGEYKYKFTKAREKKNTFRYVAKISKDNLIVKLKEVSLNSDMGNLKGPNNIIIFKTKRYLDRPMIIKGPGAGPEVTAAGVFGDILQIAGVI